MCQFTAAKGGKGKAAAAAAGNIAEDAAADENGDLDYDHGPFQL